MNTMPIKTIEKYFQDNGIFSILEKDQTREQRSENFEDNWSSSLKELAKLPLDEQLRVYEEQIESNKDEKRIAYNFRGHLEMYQHIFGYVKDNGVHDLVELGCGSGLFGNFLNDHSDAPFDHIDYMGIDNSSKAIDGAKNRAKKLDLLDYNSKPDSFKQMSPNDFIGTDKRADLVIGINILNPYNPDQARELISAAKHLTRDMFYQPSLWVQKYSLYDGLCDSSINESTIGRFRSLFSKEGQKLEEIKTFSAGIDHVYGLFKAQNYHG